MKPTVILMNFTHVYEKEIFMDDKVFTWIDCTDIPGTDCYCDTEAEKELQKRIAPYSEKGIHFIDSGNFHYMSKLWIDKIVEPFSLVVFDHHPDMQGGAFNNILSCGSWVKAALDSHPFLKKVLIVGASDHLIQEVSPKYRQRVKFYSETALSHQEAWVSFSKEHVNEAVYISIDKDVLNTASAQTNWDQGSLSLKDLSKLLHIIHENESVIGVDICGECSQSLNYIKEKRELALNGKANHELLQLFLSQ